MTKLHNGLVTPLLYSMPDSSSTSSRNLHSELIVSRLDSSCSSFIKAIDSFILRAALFGQKGALLGSQLDTTRVRNQCRASLVPVSTRACNVLQPAHYGSYVNFIRFVLEHVPVRSCGDTGDVLNVRETFLWLSFENTARTTKKTEGGGRRDLLFDTSGKKNRRSFIRTYDI